MLFLAMIGSWGTQHKISLNAIESTHEDDCEGIVTLRQHIEGNLYRFGSESEIVNNTSMYAFHLQCLHFEHMQVANAYMLMKRIPSSIQDLKTKKPKQHKTRYFRYRKEKFQNYKDKHRGSHF